MIRFYGGSGEQVSLPGGVMRRRTSTPHRAPGTAARREKNIPRAALFAAVLALAVPGGLFAQSGPPPGVPSIDGASTNGTERRLISPEEAVRLAIENNLDLASARIDTEAARRASALSWNTFIPTVSVGAGMQRSNYEQTQIVPLGSPVPPGVVITLPRWGLGATISAQLQINAAMFEEIRAARLSYRNGLLSYEQAKARIERDVRKAYYDMLLLEEQIALSRESFETTRRQAAMAQANYRSGLIPETQYLQAQVAVETMKPQMEQAESGLRLAKASFANNLGLPLDTAFDLVPLEAGVTYIPLEVAELISRAASDNPDVQSLRRQILTTRNTRTQTILRMYTPSLTLSWNAAPVFVGDPMQDGWFDSDRWSQPLRGNFSFNVGFMLNTFFPFTTQGQQLKSLDDGLDKLNIGLAQAIRGTELKINNTVASLEQARLSAEAQGYTVELAQRSLRMAEQAYRSGASDFLEVRNAELQLYQARLSVLQQQFNYIKGLIDLEYDIGVSFGTLSSRERIP
jgi:outer membrane protein TolC